MPKALPLLLAVATALPATAATGPWQVNAESRVRLVSPWDAAPRTGELRLGLHFRLAPGWHVYWKNSGDAGYPPALDLSPTPGVSDARLLWPAPERFDLAGGLVAFGYADEVVYPVRAHLARAAADHLAVAADLDYLVCRVDCVPYSYRLTLDQPLAPAGSEGVATTGEEGRLLERWEARVPVAPDAVPGVATRGYLDLRSPSAPIVVVEVTGARQGPSGADLFFETHPLFEVGRPHLTTSPGRLRFRVPLAYRAVPTSPVERTELAWTVTGLLAPDGQPLAITTKREVRERTEAAPGGFPGLGDLAGLLLAGLALALTPATLAALVATLLAARAELDASLAALRARALGTAAGIGASLAAVALFAAGAVGRGAPAAWGLQLQEPSLLAFQAVLALLLALNLWGLTDAPLPVPATRKAEPGRGDRVRAAAQGLATGIVAALLALPWNPPLPGDAVGRALRGGYGASLLAGLALALGLALPYLLAAAAPRALGLLPRPGTGARRWRQALGFLAAGTGVWVLYVLGESLSPEVLAGVELALLGVALAAWARRQAAGRRGLERLLRLSLLVLAAVAIALAAG